MTVGFEFIFTYVVTYVFVASYCAVILTRTSSDMGSELEVRFFRRMVFALIIYCVLESIWAVGNFGHVKALTNLNVPLSIANSILVNAFCYYWFCFVESRLQSKVVDRRRTRVLVFLPFGFAIALAVTTLFTGWVFYLLPDGTIERGPLYIVSIVIAYGYAVVTTLRVLGAAIKTTSKAKRRELLILATFGIPPAIVGVIDTIQPLMPIVAPAFFFSFLMAFTLLQELQISHDALTGLNNRRRADLFLDEGVAHAAADDPFVFFIVDGDGFKSVNDVYGHLEGDRALRIIADVLRDACNDNHAFAARWGGDEFVVMGRMSEVRDPEGFAELIASLLKERCLREALPYALSVTIGYALCSGAGQTKRELIEAADTMLYERKNARNTFSFGRE